MKDVQIKRTSEGIILEDEEISVYDSLKEEVDKLIRNIEGLGKEACPGADINVVRNAGLKVLKDKYPKGYENLTTRIRFLMKQYIKIYCLNVMFFQDAAEAMLVPVQDIIKKYVSDRSKDMSDAIFKEYSVDRFTVIADEVRQNVVELAMDNWVKHNSIQKKLQKKAA